MRYKIREALKIKGITSKQMASILGVSEGTFSGYVNGDHDPKSENLSRIAITCGVSTDFLLGITDDPNPKSTNAPEPATTSSEAKEEEIYQMLKKLVADLHIDLSALTDRQKIALEIISNIIADNF